MGLSGRNAVVTGGASGIGRAICLRLARDGADVAVLDLDQGGGRQVADEVAALHRRAIAVEADVASAASVAAAVERLHAALGPVHILVNDAGIAGLVPLREMTEDEWDRMIAVHLKGAFNCTRALLGDMAAAGWGRIVNVSSVAGLRGAPQLVHYSAAKAGLIGFTTTHAGSLPRTPELTALLVRRSRRAPVDPGALGRAIVDSTRRVVARQLAAGIDVGNDGEQARESFFTYVQHRMSGFGGTSERPIMRDITHFPSYLALRLPDFSRTQVSLMAAPKVVGEVRYVDRAALDRECALFQEVVREQDGRFVEPFMTAPSPGIIAAAMTNEHYPRLEDYVHAVATALRAEYEYIVAQGFVLQIDCPDLAMERHTRFADRPLAQFLAFMELVVGAINAALANVPRERVRLHVCWGNYNGPHVFDVPLEEIIARLYVARVGALVLSMANPRHAHEHRVLARHPLPPDMLLVAGVIDTTTNYVEHPEVVADRIERAAQAVGDPRRVIAGTDCGFATAAGMADASDEVVRAKLRALREGADLVTRRLL